MSTESIEKMKANLPDRHGANHPMFGKHHTEAAKEKNRLAHIGKPNANKGKHMPKEAYINRQIMVRCIELDTVFESISAAAKALNSTTGNIIKVCKHLRGHNTVHGYHLEYYNLKK